MKIKSLPALIVIALLLASCNKDNGVCVSSTGKVVQRERPALPFNRLAINDNINVFLTQDSALNKIVVEAGENLIDGITTEIDSGRLVLKNENSCNWLRSFNVPVNVYITFTQLDSISTRAAGNITFTNAWTTYSAYLEVVEGAGDLNIKLNTYRSYFMVFYGTTDLNITGVSEVATLISYGFGPVHAEDLDTKFTYVSCYSSNDMFVSSSLDLEVKIGNIGNVYYRGNPATIVTEYYSSGRLIYLLAR
jgi:hypothetical protein